MNRDGWGALARWPLLLGSAVLLTAGVALAPPPEDVALSAACVALAAVLLGSWVALYATGDRDPRDTPDRVADADDVDPM